MGNREEPNLKLFDYLKINPPSDYAKLGKEDKLKCMDSMFSVEDKEKRGLIITFDLSHSGRRINNRIYPSKGQQAGIDTLTDPFPKPILRNHDEHEDPIGRFIGGEWQDLSHEAINYFSDIKDFMVVREAFDSDNPEKIYKALKKYDLLTNPKWPGLGRMRVQARVSDEKAVEKFLDGRYITFSAYHKSDRHVCSVCGTDWMQEDFCEHRHGGIYDGEICVFVVGLFGVQEGSVVNGPGDDLAQMVGMQLMTDSGEPVSITDDRCLVGEDNLYCTDSVYSMEGKNMPGTPEEEARKKAEEAKRAAEAKALKDAEAKVAVELEKLKKDKEQAEQALKDAKDEADKLKAEKEEADRLAAEKAKKDKEEADKKAAELAKEEEKRKAEEQAALDAKAKKAKEEADKKLKEEIDAFVSALPDEVNKDAIKALFAKAMDEDQDGKLTSKQRKSLKKGTFCGPDKSYPVPDKAHAANALARAKQHASGDLYKKIKACVCRKANENGWNLPACKAGDEELDKGIEWSVDLTNEAFSKEAMITSGVDWWLFESLLHDAVGDEKLSDEDRSGLDENIFLGPAKTFPLCNDIYVEAARKVIKESDLEDEDKEEFIRFIDQKIEDINREKGPGLHEEHEELQKDHANLLKEHEKLENNLADVLSLVAGCLDKSFDNKKDEVLVEMLTWYKTLDTESIVKNGKLKTKIEDPGIANSDNDALKNLGSYEKKVVEEYREILKEKGKDAADDFLNAKKAKGYLCYGFQVPTDSKGE